jgi:protein TonB
MNKNTHDNKLQKSSGIFLPLGLVLTLLMVYFLLESKTVIANNVDRIYSDQSFDPIEFVEQNEILIERKKVNKVEKGIDKKTLDVRDTFTKTDEELVKETELPFEKNEPEIEKSDFSNNFVEFPEDPIDEDVSFVLIEDAPIFPGCEKMKTKEDKKVCFSKKLNSFISRKFNANLTSNLGLPLGTQKIFVQFMITKMGQIEIIDARASHVSLEKEGKRIVKLLPKMIPGKQRNNPVNVRYMLPISFSIE